MFCLQRCSPRESCLAKPVAYITAITITAPFQVKGFKFSPYLGSADCSNSSAAKPTKLAAFMATCPQQEAKPAAANKLSDFLAACPSTYATADKEEEKIQAWSTLESPLHTSSPEELKGSFFVNAL